ncbi:MAG: hypothetical protein R3D03_22535, partial [Geminicoccaceae bacterium]
QKIISLAAHAAGVPDLISGRQLPAPATSPPWWSGVYEPFLQTASAFLTFFRALATTTLNMMDKRLTTTRYRIIITTFAT